MTDICPMPQEMGGGCGGLGTPNGLARSYNNVILAPFPREMYSGEKIPVRLRHPHVLLPRHGYVALNDLVHHTFLWSSELKVWTPHRYMVGRGVGHHVTMSQDCWIVTRFWGLGGSVVSSVNSFWRLRTVLFLCVFILVIYKYKFI